MNASLRVTSKRSGQVEAITRSLGTVSIARARAGANNLASLRVPCGGKRRRDGQPCDALSVPGKRRCKWHGGCSTGPRTVTGKAKVTANLPRRR